MDAQQTPAAVCLPCPPAFCSLPVAALCPLSSVVLCPLLFAIRRQSLVLVAQRRRRLHDDVLRSTPLYTVQVPLSRLALFYVGSSSERDLSQVEGDGWLHMKHALVHRREAAHVMGTDGRQTSPTDSSPIRKTITNQTATRSDRDEALSRIHRPPRAILLPHELQRRPGRRRVMRDTTRGEREYVIMMQHSPTHALRHGTTHVSSGDTIVQTQQQ